jgi:predicted cupin superfamily sugar epimerase
MIDLRDLSCSAEAVAEALDLAQHPEGGRYREVWRDRPADGTRGAATSILFLLAEGERSRWHRIDAAEIWLWQAGAPLALVIDRLGIDRHGIDRHGIDRHGIDRHGIDRHGGREDIRLGPNLGAGERLQAVVPPHAWQEARPLGAWSLVACVVAPAFAFTGFEMAPEGWSPPETGGLGPEGGWDPEG